MADPEKPRPEPPDISRLIPFAEFVTRYALATSTARAMCARTPGLAWRRHGRVFVDVDVANVAAGFSPAWRDPPPVPPVRGRPPKKKAEPQPRSRPRKAEPAGLPA